MLIITKCLLEILFNYCFLINVTKKCQIFTCTDDNHFPCLVRKVALSCLGSESEHFPA